MTTLLDGQNGSGRSKWLAHRRQNKMWPEIALLGTMAETALSGLAWTLEDELTLARSLEPSAPRDQTVVESLELDGLLQNELHTLSGGELVRAALASISLQRVHELHVESAFEQLDAKWRARVLSLVANMQGAIAREIFLTDNHLSGAERGLFPNIENFRHPQRSEAPLLETQSAIRYFGFCGAGKRISISNLGFWYQRKERIFEKTSLQLHPGKIYLLTGPNGSGKTTFIRLLSGTILPKRGIIRFGFGRFQPAGSRRRYLAVSFQNPDYQWTSQSVRDELHRTQSIAAPTDAAQRLTSFGIHPEYLDQTPLELPFATKKRLANALAICSGKSWIALDEPTLGQDQQYTTALANLLHEISRFGTGILVVSHDKEFCKLLRDAKPLLFDRQKRVVGVS